ncbi:hypothetical protein C2S52_015241 [Perilla frutescens var. hirtella]|nr:hypothetical protein C2S52_015241 [Perilla frutescens var. hirtella]
MRKITAVHLFSLKKTQSFRPICEEEISHMITKISRVSSDDDEGIVNLSEMAMALGSSLVCGIAFGKRYDEQGWEMRRFDELLHDVQAVMATFFVFDYFPSLSWVNRISGYMDWLDSTFKNLDSFYQELFKEHLDPNRAKKEDERDILDILIKLKEAKSCLFDLSWDHIKALLMNIFVAATDTSAATTVWMMTALMKAPKVMKKLQQELRNLVGKKGKVDEDDLP